MARYLIMCHLISRFLFFGFFDNIRIYCYLELDNSMTVLSTISKNRIAFGFVWFPLFIESFYHLTVTLRNNTQKTGFSGWNRILAVDNGLAAAYHVKIRIFFGLFSALLFFLWHFFVISELATMIQTQHILHITGFSGFKTGFWKLS